ncbi:demethylmenaquinone methyltransferase [Halobacillus sp. A5]|uniref:demethylmenaquinone methyltransferase n=1 Tax=Halobacillus sp. A5 TaxID=2880263 RepID=UPI0020A6734D|nr:demethylmenaquinone methyltransferase [Halobacillus sp. A5]MCP3025854.1 demethylmenaquinone methyltransferase [Halobacillus sp. A5]
MQQQSKEERVHHVFEKIYNRYDAMNSIISFQQHRLWRKDVMKRMKVKRGGSTLDVCCGTGDWTMSLAGETGPSGKVIGLDFSENMLSVAIRKKLESRMKHVEFQHGNAMALPFEDNQFDYVTIGFGLRNVPDYLQVLKEMHRVVKPGGKVVCLETSQPTNPVFKRLYYFYFGYIMPVFGKLFARSYNEYSWLHESAKDFPGKVELADLFYESGLVDVQVKSYTGGAAAMHMGEKPS